MLAQKIINVLPIFIVTFFMMALIFEVPNTPQTAEWEQAGINYQTEQSRALEAEIAAAKIASMYADIQPAAGDSTVQQCTACPCECAQ